MPDRYHIHTVPTPGQFHRIGKFGSVDWREDCSRCSNCVKPRCLFDVHKHEAVHNRDPLAAIQTLNECKACLSCVQGCTKGLLSLSVNPEFLDMGDDYWTPDIISGSWTQSDSGKIPVSGAGYRGRFHGPGFDSIWTDMSEIVRPTRDGIHGREYISTSVDIGPKPMRLSFNPEGKLITPPLNLMEIQMPAILDLPPWPVGSPELAFARAKAARELKTVAVIFARDAVRLQPEFLPSVAPVFADDDVRKFGDLIENCSPMVQLLDSPEIPETADRIRAVSPRTIISVRTVLGPESADRIVTLSKCGLKVFHLCAGLHGLGQDGRHIKDALREIHARLVDEGLRDEITIIVSGGIALAEHMAKAIICGADLVAVDTALLVAVGCRVCRGVHHRPDSCGVNGVNQDVSGMVDCPAGIGSVDSTYAARRMVNLMGAWHSQLVEVLGAMGIREVRRLRGEMGRAIFMEEIEKEAFGDLLRVPREQACA